MRAPSVACLPLSLSLSLFSSVRFLRVSVRVAGTPPPLARTPHVPNPGLALPCSPIIHLPHARRPRLAPKSCVPESHWPVLPAHRRLCSSAHGVAPEIFRVLVLLKPQPLARPTRRASPSRPALCSSRPGPGRLAAGPTPRRSPAGLWFAWVTLPRHAAGCFACAHEPQPGLVPLTSIPLPICRRLVARPLLLLAPDLFCRLLRMLVLTLSPRLPD